MESGCSHPKSEQLQLWDSVQCMFFTIDVKTTSNLGPIWVFWTLLSTRLIELGTSE